MNSSAISTPRTLANARSTEIAWRACSLASPPKPHYAALKEILDAYAGNLAAAIDRQSPSPGQPQRRRLLADPHQVQGGIQPHVSRPGASAGP